jgi:hypothetical protein
VSIASARLFNCTPCFLKLTDQVHEMLDAAA